MTAAVSVRPVAHSRGTGKGGAPAPVPPKPRSPSRGAADSVARYQGGLPGSGQVVRLTGEASVQFAIRPIYMRVIRVLPAQAWGDDWIWLEGYQLDATGDAGDRRSVFVRIWGLRS